jgi:hypothetical protein
MPGDPKECRKHALRCSELAATVQNEELKKTLLNLAKTWTRLAVELESANALLDMVDPKPK